MTKCAPFILVDGSSYLYRAFYAMVKADLRNTAGEPTGAVRGVTAMLRRLKKDYPNSNIAVVFDARGKTFRNDIYQEYKAQRPPMPTALRSQNQNIHKIIQAMGFPIISIAGVEADDVIGTLTHQATKKGIEVIISTGDKDMAQLVNRNVTLVNTMTNTYMDIEGVKEKFGLPPELIVDYLALKGDKADNIPGVPGIGEKTALCLLQNINGLNAIYKNLESVRILNFRGAKYMHKKLAKNRDLAKLSYLLATIKSDVILNIQLEELNNSSQDNEALTQVFYEMEFTNWIAELSS